MNHPTPAQMKEEAAIWSKANFPTVAISRYRDAADRISALEAVKRDEVGWLIEDSGRTMWLRIIRHSQYETKAQWTDDANVALRFSRKEDAENFWFLCPQPGIIPSITEHKFCSQADGGGEHGN